MQREVIANKTFNIDVWGSAVFGKKFKLSMEQPYHVILPNKDCENKIWEITFGLYYSAQIKRNPKEIPHLKNISY